MQRVSLEELIKTGNAILENRNYFILGNRKKSRMDQVGQLGVPTSWLSPYCQREVYSSRRPVLRLLKTVVMGMVKDACDIFWRS